MGGIRVLKEFTGPLSSSLLIQATPGRSCAVELIICTLWILAFFLRTRLLSPRRVGLLLFILSHGRRVKFTFVIVQHGSRELSSAGREEPGGCVIVSLLRGGERGADPGRRQRPGEQGRYSQTTTCTYVSLMSNAVAYTSTSVFIWAPL